jgi:hypothetical protein
LKKIVSILILVIFLVTGLTACQKRAGEGDKAVTAKKRETKGEKKEKTGKADLNGMVTEVFGNEITIKVIEVTEENSEKDKEEKNVKKENNDKENSKQKKEDKTAEAAKKEGQDSVEKKFGVTGETKTITVPVGIPITVMTKGDKEEEPKLADIRDIKKGNIIQIWYSEKDKTVITKINIMIVDKKNAGSK